jgi:hypothetical protein
LLPRGGSATGHEMTVTATLRGGAIGALILALGSAWLGGPAHAACDFAPVKQAIDAILDKDAQKGATFRAEVKSGSDSIAMIEKLVTPDMQEKVDICRYQTSEYLTKRGFPPVH